MVLRTLLLHPYILAACFCLYGGPVPAWAAEGPAPIPPPIVPSSPPSAEAIDQENLAAVAAGPVEKKADNRGMFLPAKVQVVTTPGNIPFRVLASAYETANPDVVYTGNTPATVDGLPPGPHRIIFSPAGGSERSMIMQVPEQGRAIFHQEFPYGELKVSSQPAGATVICDGQKIGPTPLKVPISVGKHRVTAVWQGREARARTITAADGGAQSLAFDFRPAIAGKKKPARSGEPAPLLTRVSRTVTKFFSDSTDFLTGNEKDTPKTNAGLRPKSEAKRKAKSG